MWARQTPAPCHRQRRSPCTSLHTLTYSIHSSTHRGSVTSILLILLSYCSPKHISINLEETQGSKRPELLPPGPRSSPLLFTRLDEQRWSLRYRQGCNRLRTWLHWSETSPESYIKTVNMLASCLPAHVTVGKDALLDWNHSAFKLTWWLTLDLDYRLSG